MSVHASVRAMQGISATLLHILPVLSNRCSAQSCQSVARPTRARRSRTARTTIPRPRRTPHAQRLQSQEHGIDGQGGGQREVIEIHRSPPVADDEAHQPSHQTAPRDFLISVCCRVHGKAHQVTSLDSPLRRLFPATCPASCSKPSACSCIFPGIVAQSAQQNKEPS